MNENNQQEGLRKGTLLRNATYRIEKVLGRGGFGITYLATDLNLDRLVAIKEFFPKNLCNREFVTDSDETLSLSMTGNKELMMKLKMKFLKEARNIAKLDHPGIVKIHSAFEENNTAYYVMDYIKGKSLSEMIKRQGPLPVGKAIEYVKKVGKALIYIHSHNINHLDVKPANIIIREKDDNPVLIDFGLSKHYDSKGEQTSTTLTGISHGYAPLEQYNPKGVSVFSPKPDVYSLGATLYFLLSGKVPQYAGEIAANGISYPEGFPYEIRGCITRAMSLENVRYENIEMFLNTLKNFQSSININLEESVNNPETNYIHPGYTPNFSDSGKDKKVFKRKIIKWVKLVRWGIAVVGIIFVIAVVVSKNIEENKESNILEEPAMTMQVSNVKYKNDLGEYIYTGDIDKDSLPHGHGVAIWEKGEAKNYQGEWVHGVMEGRAIYTHRSGDTFDGTFVNGHYGEGKYTVYPSGEYFEGTFKDGQPNEGTWYNKKGKILQ